MGEDNYADLWAAFRDPAAVHGMYEDYRAGLRVDRAHKEADRAAVRKIGCSMLLLVSTEDDLDIHGDPEGNLATMGRELRSNGSTPRTTRPKMRRTNSPRYSCSSSDAPRPTRPLNPASRHGPFPEAAPVNRLLFRAAQGSRFHGLDSGPVWAPPSRAGRPR
jgi:hypothetical protein